MRWTVLARLFLLILLLPLDILDALLEGCGGAVYVLCILCRSSSHRPSSSVLLLSARPPTSLPPTVLPYYHYCRLVARA